MQFEEAMRALDGIGRFARLDASGNSAFGRDMQACRRSFLVYLLILPAICLTIAFDVEATDSGAPGLFAAIVILGTIIQYAGFPILVRLLLRIYGRLDRWAWFVTAYNWFNAAQIVTFLAVVGLLLGPLGGIGPWPLYAIQLYFFVVEAFLAETILSVGAWKAGGIVLLDGLFGYGIDHVGRWIASGSFF